LGPVRVSAEGGPLPLSAPTRLGLLALLLARANTPVPADSLLDALWGDQQEPVGVQRLQTNVHRLRKELDAPGRLTHASGHYLLRVEHGELDSDRFDELVGRATTTKDAVERAALLRSALGLWRGAPFQGVDLRELVGHAQLLTERRQVALEELYAAELECGRHTEAVADLGDLARRYPLRERLQALLMTALYRSGRQADALAVYRRARRHLLDELGLEPGPELRQTEHRILQGEDIVPAPRAPVAPPRPAQLPARPRDLVGRDDERAVLDRLAGSPGGEAVQVVIVTGTAGVGKTTLATSWAQEHREEFPDGQLYVDLQGFSPHDPLHASTALAGFLAALGEERRVIPPGLAERAARFRTLTHDRRLVVVLDNAVTANQVRPLLPGGASCFVIVTSRDPLSGLAAGLGAHRLELGPLTEDEALALLWSRVDPAGAAAEPAARLIEHCGRLPLALRVAAERLHGPHAREIGELVDELDAEHGHLDLLDTGDDHTSIRGLLSWSYRQLSPDAARLFRLCGFRCPHPHHYIDPDQAAALRATDDLRATRRLLDELVRFGLVEQVRDGRYGMHTLVQAYAAELAVGEEDQGGAQRRLAQYHLDTVASAVTLIHPPESSRRSEPDVTGHRATLNGCADALRWLDARRSEILCVAGLGYPDVNVDLSIMLWPYLELGGHHDEAGRLHAVARTAARELGDRAGEGIAARALGARELRLEQYDGAELLLEEARALHEDEPDESIRATTAAYSANTMAATGRVAEALAAARSVAELHHTDAVALSSMALITLGRVHAACDRLREAARWLQQAHDIAQRRGHRPVQARALLDLADAHRDCGRVAAARECYERAAALAREHGIVGLGEPARLDDGRDRDEHLPAGRRASAGTAGGAG